MHPPDTLHSRAFIACLGAGLMLLCLPISATQAVRELVRTVLLPGQKMLLAMRDQMPAQASAFVTPNKPQQHGEMESLRRRLAVAEFRARQAWLVATEAQQRLERGATALPGTVTTGQPLFAVRALEARVVGNELAAQWKAKRLLQIGGRDGLLQDQWVLDGADLAIDQAEDGNIVPGQMVFAGRAVVGRIADAGRFVSSVELLTSKSFRAQAALGRSVESRLVFSQVGLLVGEGDGKCRLTLPDRNASVATGDAVYSVPADGGFEVPLLLGHVESASLGPLHWDVVVKPAVDVSQLRMVQVLTTILNPERLQATNSPIKKSL